MQCALCEHKIRKPADSYTLFGCSNYDPPEPLDPGFICRKCYKKFEKGWDKHFEAGLRGGDYLKSDAERKMAKKHKLVWVGSNGVGVLGTKYFLDPYKYYNKKVYDALDSLPYWGWCLKCGARRSGGFCSDVKCEDSFNFKEEK